MRVIVCILVFLVSAACSKNILGLFTSSGKSHLMIFDSLMRELAARGHNIVVVSPFEQTKPMENCTYISFKKFKAPLENVLRLDEPTGSHNFIDLAKGWLGLVDKVGNVLQSPDIKNLISLNKTSFDVVFVELFADEVFLLLAKKFNAPVIGFSSSTSFYWALSKFAAPQNPSYIPNFNSGYGRSMTFFQRLRNALLNLGDSLLNKYWLGPKSVEVFEKHLGKSEWSLEDAAKNMSLFLVNTHFSLDGARPFPPQVVEVGGMHLQPAKPLSKDLDQWMNESIEGVVYFSFGSMLRGATLPADKVNVFLQVFKSLKQRVLWKWEDEAVDGLPSNVKVMKWLPQRDVLAHPKVKVFISHGGLLGTTEAVVSGVPILGIPMYGDQPNNVAALVEKGVGIHVDYNNISVASLSYALNTLINDKSYSENVRELSRRFLDRPMSPLDTAVYWTEYVIRHRGAPHLQSYAVHLPWYQYYLLDVISVCLAALMIVLVVFYYVIRSFLRVVCSFKTTKLKTN